MDFFVLDSFLLIGKQWFNPFNAFLYVALIVLIYWHSQRQVTLRFNPYILALIIVFCWLSLPDFALVTIWMTGACVYLLTAVLIFSFLLPYHFDFLGKPLLRDSSWSAWGMFLGGVAASWTIENTAATMNLIIAGLIYYASRKHGLKKWMITGFCGTILGYSLLIIAPGNYVRYAGSSSKLIFHGANQLAAGFEIFLGSIPVVLFMILAWRIVITEYAKQQGSYLVKYCRDDWGIGIGTILWVIIFLIMSLSRLDGLFVRNG